MKKISLFGKQISVLLVLGVIMALSATAAVVTYLSNTKTMTLSIESPMVMRFDEGFYEDAIDKDLGLIQGGETVSFTIWSKNNADVAISTYPITTIISTQDWTGNEFSSVIFKNAAYTSGIEILSMLYYVKDDGSLGKFEDGITGVADMTSLKLFFDNNGDGVAQKYTHPAGVEDWNTLEITTNPAIASDNYQIRLCHLNNLTGACV